MKINEATNVQMPLKTVISLIVLVAAFTMGYFQITEKLNRLETANQLMEADLLKKAEQTPKNLEIYMLNYIVCLKRLHSRQEVYLYARRYKTV